METSASATSVPRPPVEHDRSAGRFLMRLPQGRAECVYRRQGDTLLFTHTEVPVALEGRGIASTLVGAALQWARAEGLQVRPLCSYVAAWMRRHPEYDDLRAG